MIYTQIMAVSDITIDINQTGAVGMSYAWTGRTDLRVNGYDMPDSSSSYCYIGHNGPSHPLSLGVEGTAYTYEDFVELFYYYLIEYNGHNTVRSALDNTCFQIWGEDFGDCEIHDGYWLDVPGFEYPQWGQMVVFGNGDLTIPYS